MPTIGYLYAGSLAEGRQENVEAFVKGLDETGYVEGRNVRFEYREAKGDLTLPPSLLAGRRPGHQPARARPNTRITCKRSDGIRSRERSVRLVLAAHLHAVMALLPGAGSSNTSDPK